MKRQATRGGFTLVELVVVLFILVLAAAVVAPSVSRGTEAVRAQADVAGFTSFLRYARAQAVTRRQAQVVRIDPDARLVTLTASGEDKVRASRQLGERLSIQASPPAALTLRFLPEGVSSGAVFRIDASGRVFVVSVDPLTGGIIQRRGGA